MNKTTIYSIVALLIVATAIILGLVFGMPSDSETSTKPSTAQQSSEPSVTPPPPSPPVGPEAAEAPVAQVAQVAPAPPPPTPPPSSFEDISDKAMSDTQKLILKNTSFALFEIKLLIDSFNFNNDTITIKTSPDSKKQLTWTEVGLVMTYKPEDPTFPTFTEAQARLIKKIIVDDVEFNFTNNSFYTSYFAFTNSRLGDFFDKLINSHYKIDRFKIKYTDNSFSTSSLSFVSDLTSTKEMTLDLIKNELSSRLSGRIIPETAKTITINNKLILDVEHIPNEKRFDPSPAQTGQSGSGNFTGFTQTVEQKTGIRIFTIKKISEKIQIPEDIPEDIPKDIPEDFLYSSNDYFGIF